MEVQLINDNLLSVLHWKAKENERKRVNFDLRTTPDDSSQRMLNVMEVGTKVPIHRQTPPRRSSALKDVSIGYSMRSCRVLIQVGLFMMVKQPSTSTSSPK